MALAGVGAAMATRTTTPVGTDTKDDAPIASASTAKLGIGVAAVAGTSLLGAVIGSRTVGGASGKVFGGLVGAIAGAATLFTLGIATRSGDGMMGSNGSSPSGSSAMFS